MFCTANGIPGDDKRQHQCEHRAVERPKDRLQEHRDQSQAQNDPGHGEWQPGGVVKDAASPESRARDDVRSD